MAPFSITSFTSKRAAPATPVAPIGNGATPDTNANASVVNAKDPKRKPSSSSDKPEDAAAEETDAPLSRPLSPVTNQTYNSKDTRAYEHARQRNKHAQDFAKKRAKKEERKIAAALAKGASATSAGGRSSGVSASSGVGGGRSAASGGHGGARLVTSADVEVDEDEILMAPIERGSNTASGARAGDRKVGVTTVSAGMVWSPAAAAAQKQESGIRVNLADLITVVEKKPKKVGVNRADDFEVVPHVKAVIALDDVEEDMELDEPWEHVQADEERVVRFGHKGEPSYASIVSGIATPAGLD